MSKEDVFDYVMNSPENTNPSVLKSLLNDVGSSELPVATADTLGGIKVGSGLSITEEGVLSSSGGGSGLPSVTSSDEGRCLQVSSDGQWIATWPVGGPENFVPNFTVVENSGTYSIVSGSTFTQCQKAASTTPNCMAIIYGPCFDGGACLPLAFCVGGKGDDTVLFSGILPSGTDLYAVAIKVTEEETKTVVVKKLT